MDNKKAIIELIEHIEGIGEQFKINSPKVVCRINYTQENEGKDFILFSIRGKLIKSVNPLITFISKKQPYFKNSTQACILFIEQVFNKKLDLNTNKPFSKFEIELVKLKEIKIKLTKEHLDEQLDNNKVENLNRKMKI